MTRDQIREHLGPVGDCLEEHGLLDEAVERIQEMLLAVPVTITNETTLRIGIRAGARITAGGECEHRVSIVDCSMTTTDEMAGRSPSALEMQRELIRQVYADNPPKPGSVAYFRRLLENGEAKVTSHFAPWDRQIIVLVIAPEFKEEFCISEIEYRERNTIDIMAERLAERLGSGMQAEKPGL
jgi:hypothetical protein